MCEGVGLLLILVWERLLVVVHQKRLQPHLIGRKPRDNLTNSREVVAQNSDWVASSSGNQSTYYATTQQKKLIILHFGGTFWPNATVVRKLPSRKLRLCGRNWPTNFYIALGNSPLFPNSANHIVPFLPLTLPKSKVR
jgi:hypothetical protein